MGLGFEKLIVIGVVALFLIGPERLPEYATKLARLVRSLRRMLDDAKERVRDEMGVDLDDEEWRRLDPRQYDPRRIIRDALLEPSDDGLQPEPVRAERTPYEPGRPVVFDPEAT